MKILLLALFFTSFALGFAWESSGDFKDPAHPGKCVTSGLILSPGEEGYPKGKCLRILCGSNGMGKKQGCGSETMILPCKFGDYKYPNEPYPKCCDREIICP